MSAPQRLAAIGRLIEQAPLHLPDYVLLQVRGPVVGLLAGGLLNQRASAATSAKH